MYKHVLDYFQAPYVDITAKRVQIDVAGKINTTGQAPSSLQYQDAQQKPDGGQFRIIIYFLLNSKKCV